MTTNQEDTLTVDQIETVLATARRARNDHVNFEVRRFFEIAAAGFIDLFSFTHGTKHA